MAINNKYKNLKQSTINIKYFKKWKKYVKKIYLVEGLNV